MSKFSDYQLLPQTLRALKKQAITEPTPIQQETIPLLLESCDVIGQARTGSGKTLAFALPMLEFIEPRQKRVQALVLTPTRELANQITDVINGLTEEDSITTLAVFGGRSINPQIASLKRGVQIVVATPGRLVDLLQRGAIKLDDVRYAVIDEADEMLDKGFARDVETILGKLTSEHVTALFSATMPEWVHQASRKYLYKPEHVAVEVTPEEAPKIEHVALSFPDGHRMDVLRSLLDDANEGSSIVFGRTKRGVRKLARRLEDYGYSVSCLQGNMSQNARDRVMQDFREHNVSVLVATNVAARGLDVDHVELVVNYELPESAELLTHRVGRTGRMGREGHAYTLVSNEDESAWTKLRRGVRHPISAERWGGGTSAAVKQNRRPRSRRSR